MKNITIITIKYINNGNIFHFMIDKKDMKILEILKENSKLTTSQIYKKTNIPITTVHNRIKKLESIGVIKNFTININYSKINKPILAFILVTVNYNLASGKKIDQEDLAKKIKLLEGSEESFIVSGETDIILKVRVSSIEELNNFILKKLRNIEGIDKTRTTLVLNQL